MNCSEEEEDQGVQQSLMGGGPAARPLWLYASDAHVWHKVAGVSGMVGLACSAHPLASVGVRISFCVLCMVALACGTYGSHIFKPQNEAYKDVWKTANLYHLTHTAALLAAPMTKRPHIFGGLMTFGIAAFSGSCYVAALMEDKSYSLPAPFGGFAFIAGWASLLF